MEVFSLADELYRIIFFPCSFFNGFSFGRISGVGRVNMCFGSLSTDRGKPGYCFSHQTPLCQCVFVSSHQCGLAGCYFVEGIWSWRIQDRLYVILPGLNPPEKFC